MGPHPLRRFAVRMLPEQSTLDGGRERCLAVQNAGVTTWTAADKILIGTANPRDGHSAFYDSSWMGRNRICSFSEAAVPPGATATFRFRISPSAHVADESFQLVVEHQCWVPGTRFEVRGDTAGSAMLMDSRRARTTWTGLWTTIRRMLGPRA
jgi:hypothetical protein